MEALSTVLNTYAFYNPEIEYCQGMNYIAGFLLALYKNEESAFKVLHAITDKYNMADLFNPDIPSLKLFFLQLDRMLCLTNPDLFTHFEAEEVTSSYYGSAWFITVFTNSLLSNVSEKEPHTCNETLLQLWDYFIISGWKAITKLGLYLLNQEYSQLHGKSFE